MIGGRRDLRAEKKLSFEGYYDPKMPVTPKLGRTLVKSTSEDG